MRFFLILFLLFPFNVSAETIAVSKEGGNVTVINYKPSAKDSLIDILTENGLIGRPMESLEGKSLPPRADREFWTLENRQIIVDSVKKSTKEQSKQDKENRLKTLRKKLCSSCTDEELAEVFRG